MINNFLRNFCLITFALVAPITLPAGGIQKSLNQNKFLNNTREITLSSNPSLYSFPEVDAQELLVLDIGTSLSILRNWKVNENEIWVRVELASNNLLDANSTLTQISLSLTFQFRNTDKFVPISRTNNSLAVISGEE